MKSKRVLTSLNLSVVCFFLMTSIVWAEQFFSDSQYEIHYNAFNSIILAPQVASAYDITRAGNQGIINITVLSKQDRDKKVPVAANVTGEITNLLQQTKALDFRIIREQDAVYAITQFQFTNEDRLQFSLKITPEGQNETYEIDFTNTFYLD